MTRALLVATAAMALVACSQSEPTKTDPEKEQAAQPGRLEARVNMAPIAPAKAKAMMHHRHEGMETIGDNFKALRRELGGSSPDMAKVATAAATIDRLAKQSAGWFPAGTGPEAGKTEAKAEIWQKPQDFAAKHAAFQKAASAFNAAAKGGNAGAAKAAFGDLGKSCKACHDLYREEH
jgi:cytochrome c556